MPKRSFFYLLRIKLYRFFLNKQNTLLSGSYLFVLAVLFSISFLSLYHHFFPQNKENDLVLYLISIGSVLFGLFNFLMASISIAQRESQLQNLKKLVLIDQLTGIYNKGFFLTKLQTELLRSRRYNHILSIIIIDIDYFKKLNDTLGHIAGDVVLRNVADLIKSQIRLVDFLCRFGGEEFVILCPETGVHEAKMIGERIRKKIESTRFEYHNKKINVTVSIGINQYDPIKKISENNLFHGADQALYYAKNNGRNQSAIFTSKVENLPTQTTTKKTNSTKSKKNNRRSKVS